MPLIRILVDGYSLLHAWPELARGKARHSEQARGELIAELTRYQDATGTPITVFFDGNGPKSRRPRDDSNNPVEVLYSSASQTADDLIERAAFRFAPFGQVMVVTDDHAEKDTVTASGALTSGCWSFIRTLEQESQNMQRNVQWHNRREAQRFQKTTSGGVR